MPGRGAKAARARRAAAADEERPPVRSRVCPACQHEFEGRGPFCHDCATAAGLTPAR